MIKRERIIRIISILIVLIYALLPWSSKNIYRAEFYIAPAYIVFLIFKPMLYAVPYKNPRNLLLELVDASFIICFSIFWNGTSFFPLYALFIIRQAMLFPLYFIFLSFMLGTIYYAVSPINANIDIMQMITQLIIMIIPATMVCLVKNDVLYVDELNRSLNEKLHLKDSVITELQKYSDNMFSNNKKIEQVMKTDYVTNIPNRYYFEEILSNGMNRHKEQGFNMALMMVYIDGYTEYRKKYGYSAGHILVKTIADLISRSLKKNDYVARYEEDCIATLMFNKDKYNAVYLANVLYADFTQMQEEQPELENISLMIGVNDLTSAEDKRMLTVDRVQFLNKISVIDFTNGSIRYSDK